MNLQYPELLWLLLPIVVIFALTLSRLVRRQNVFAIGGTLLRLGVWICVVVALAVPFQSKPHSLGMLTALLDISGSITETQGEELLSKAQDLAQALSVPLTVIPFAGSTAPLGVAISSADSFRSIRAAWQRLDTGNTNINRAIRSQAVQETPFVIALTDGYETGGSLAAGLSGGSSKPVFPLTSTGEDSNTALSISQLHAPQSVPAQRSAEIRITISNQENLPLQARLVVQHGDTAVLSREITVQENSDFSVVAQSDAQLEGLHQVQARLSWQDDGGEHTVTRSTWISGEKREKVLLLSGAQEDNRFLSQILQSQSYQLHSRIMQGGSEREEGTLRDYQTILLNNVRRDQLPRTLVSGLQDYVREGGGLIVVGGSASFGLGGYMGSFLEDLLPVRLLPPQPEKKRLTVGVQLVVDKSRSMATDNRLEFAKAAAQEVVRNLKDDDFLGVMGFDEVPFIALPISRLSQVRDSAISRISRLFPTSRTNLFPALDEARRGLIATPAGRKHVIVLTDGKLPDPGRYYFDLIKQMRFVGITVSTVMVGNEADDGFLAQMAQLGGGAFYQTTDPASLPKVFLSDVKVASGERTMREASDIAVRPGPDPLVSTAIRDYPVLRGFVQTAERKEAQTELLVRDSEGTHPLLASWDLGDGRVIAYTSDASGRWSSKWMQWERIQQFWSELVDSSQRRDVQQAARRIEFDLRTWVEGTDVVMDLALFSDKHPRTIFGEVIKPDGLSSSVEFLAQKPGHFRARVANAVAGTYRANLRLGDNNSSTKGRNNEFPEVAWDLDTKEFGERPHRSPDMRVLDMLAHSTGGVVNPSSEDLRKFILSRREQESLAHEYLVIALALFMVELAIRIAGQRWWA